MNVFEMLSFDFQEFVTSPAGIMIIVGIVFLLVGIVFFLKGGKKASNQVKEEIKPVEVQPTVAETPAPLETPVAPVVEPVQEAAPVIVKATEDGVNEVPVPTVTDTLNIKEVKPAVAPVEEIKVESLESPVAPVVEAPVVESLEAAQPTVYGGASPEVGSIAAEEKPREIYGGANPLENTAPIPTATVNEAVQEVAPTVAPVTPAFEQVAAPTVPEVTPVAPAVEPVAPVAPAAPVIEPPKEEIEKLEF